MYAAGNPPEPKALRILVVRLGAMGDILHTLPAVASLKHSFPNCAVEWVVRPRWSPLLNGNPFIDSVIRFERTARGIADLWRRLRSAPYDIAIDFQGLVQSALIAASARPAEIFGLHESQARERLAALLYSRRITVTQDHVVERHLELASSAGARNLVRAFPLPEGTPEGDLPEDFILSSPFAGWVAKQWPLEYYDHLAGLIREEWNLPLVVNAAPGDSRLNVLRQTVPHLSSLDGLIHATRAARAVIGVDSGPMHLAAALGRPGIAIFGPTSPDRNGPYGGSFQTLRSPHARTTYKRRQVIEESMWQVTPEMVMNALREHVLAKRAQACQR